jgi:hypothetical protein
LIDLVWFDDEGRREAQRVRLHGVDQQPHLAALVHDRSRFAVEFQRKEQAPTAHRPGQAPVYEGL